MSDNPKSASSAPKKKSKQSSEKKSASSKAPAKAPSKKSPNKKPAPADAKKKAEVQKYIYRKKRKKAIILIIMAIICSLFFIVSGEKFWLTIHQFYGGLFGFVGFMVPVFNLYSAYQIIKKKNMYHFIFKMAVFIVTILFFSATIYAFGSIGVELNDYGTELMECFRQGKEYNGTGILGGILGIPIAKIFGATGGGIICLLAFLGSLFYSLKLLFGNLIEKFHIPVAETITKTVEMRQLVRQEEQKIKAEQRKQIQEEIARKQAEKRAETAPKEEETSPAPELPKKEEKFVDLHQVPIYRPQRPEETKTAKKPKKKVFEKLLSNLANNPAALETSEKPFFVPEPPPEKKPKKNREEYPKPVNMDYIGEDIPEFPENINIDYSKITEEETPKETYNDHYVDGEFFSPVFEKPKKRKKSPKPAPKEETPPPTVEISVEEVKQQLENKTENNENHYLFPPFTLLEAQVNVNEENISQELNNSATTLVETLKSFGVQTNIINISRGPSVTRYELQPASGVKISKITNLSDDIAMNLAATGVRIEAPIPGKSAVGIEVPNKNVSIVKMRSLVESKEFQNAKSKLTVALGMDITGKITLADLGRMPHLLIAGSTGSGKSVCINSMLVSLLYKATPEEVRLMLIDPKVVELGVYNGIPHLLVPVVTDPRKAAGALNWAVNEMLERYKTFAEYNVRDMHSYNRLVDKQNAQVEETESLDDTERTFEEDEMLAQAKADINNADSAPQEVQKLEKMPQIVIVIDELADLMMAAPNEVEESICRLAQMARAAGMHLVIATQRPSVDVITGLIKANVPSRIAFAVKSQIDSRTILDSGGAEKLLGRGDMLFSPIGTTKPIRVQGGYVDDTEIEKVVDFIKNNKIVEYDKEVIDEIERNAIPEKNKDKDNDNSDSDTDPMMEQAIECVVEAGQASTSLLQRRLRVGYARAGRLVDEMEKMGIVGPHQGAKPRDVLMTRQQLLERNLQKSD